MMFQVKWNNWRFLYKVYPPNGVFPNYMGFLFIGPFRWHWERLPK